MPPAPSTSSDQQRPVHELVEEYYAAKDKEYTALFNEEIGSDPENQREIPKMPVFPTGEVAQGIKDATKGGKDEGSKESQQQQQQGPESKASVMHHMANPGPVVAENIGEPASKDELKARAAELNK